MSKRTLREDLARYIDTEAFQSRPRNKKEAEFFAYRRKASFKRADAAIRFFSTPERFVRLRKYVMDGHYEKTANEAGVEGSVAEMDV